ncbi:hypothetical protein D6C81_05413 [Aureobasidium pullulans]|uniref:Uncharacterized protein n=1 Tax=Aureobasidium pullulans TaxID=5580 RepID=A0A4S8SUW0_AURPU|nr:hypothetical protein D6D28_02181 [Aureobasidium pullulans]TIA17807.1 hypothetical protein D6C81_05413 [Aureobasidium pullulans]
MSTTLNERELVFLGQVWQCMESVPDVDMDKLFSMAGYKTKASTNTAYHKLKAKIKSVSATAEADEADAEDSAVPSSPIKKSRGKKAVLVKAESNSEDDDEADEIAPTKPTASSRPSRIIAKKHAAVKAKTAATRASARTNKLDVQMSEDSDEDVIKPIGKGRAVKRDSTPEADLASVSAMIMAATSVDDEDVAGPAHGVKRAATQVPSDLDDFEVKRVKGEDEVLEGVETRSVSDAASNAASFGDTVPSDTEADVHQVPVDDGELAPIVHDI